jgi:membrane fusion protein, copper/silver efflux system
VKQAITFYCIIVSFIAATIGGCNSKPQGTTTDKAAAQSAQSADVYTCPMHPSVRSDKPGVCPICHMNLVKVTMGQKPGGGSADDQALYLSNTEQTLAQVSTTAVENRALVKEVHVVGKIDLAEPNTQRITARFAGRIEKLFVSFVGQIVRAGDPVALVYSPDAIAAQREYLIALSTTGVVSSDSSLLRETRSKLLLLGFTPQQLSNLAQGRTPETSLTVYSPLSGTILRKNVDVQQYVSTGEALFEVSDLRSVWLQLDVYENDLPSLKLGQNVEASIESDLTHVVRSTISFISPVLDATSRTVRVRAVLDNSAGRLRPEMFAQTTIFVPLQKSLVVPTSAVVSYGRSDIVWIEREPGHFEPRRVTLGERGGEWIQILDGVEEGDIVASRGAYLIDSESQLRKTTDGL